MTGKTTVVTLKRYSEGFSYAEYLDQIKVNKSLFQRYYQDFDLDPTSAEQLCTIAQAPGGPAKVLALGEDWCPDVYRGLAHRGQAGRHGKRGASSLPSRQ